MGPLGSLKVHVLYRKENHISVSCDCGHVGMWNCRTSDVEGTQNKDVIKRCWKCGILCEVCPFSGPKNTSVGSNTGSQLQSTPQSSATPSVAHRLAPVHKLGIPTL